MRLQRLGLVGLCWFLCVGCGGGDEALGGNGSTTGDPDDGPGTNDGDASVTPGLTTPGATVPGAPVSGQPSTAPAPVGPTATMTPAAIGVSCEMDSSCGEGLTCLSEDESFQAGSIAGGVCTMRCEQDPDYACGDSAACGWKDQGTPDTADDVGYCYDFCLYTGFEVKCDDELNRVCIPIAESGVGVCENKCFSDGECPSGKKCDPRPPWSCVDEIAEGAADGSVCSEAEECRGGICFFLAEGDETGVCMSECSMRPETAACHRDLDDTRAAVSICAPPLVLFSQGIDIGWNDLGECLATCEPTEGCAHEDWTCLEITDEEFVADVGADGICLPTLLIAEDMPVDPTDAGAPAPVSAAGGAAAAGGASAAAGGSTSGAGGATSGAGGAGGMTDVPDAG